MQGSYEYVGDDGKTYSVSWKADGEICEFCDITKNN